MEDEVKPGAENKDGKPTPTPESPPGNEPIVEGQATTPPEGAQNTPATPVPFDQDPKIQDYINRQAEKRAEAKVIEKMAEYGIKPQTQAATGDELDKIAAEIAEEHGLEPKLARSLTDKMKRANKGEMDKMRSEVDNINLTLRFGQVFANNPDGQKYSAKMQEIFNDMGTLERDFVLKSPNGPDYLFGEAKKRLGYVPSNERLSGGSGAGRSASPSSKVGDVTTLTTQAVEALKSGDRPKYEKIMSSMTRK